MDAPKLKPVTDMLGIDCRGDMAATIAEVSEMVQLDSRVDHGSFCDAVLKLSVVVGYGAYLIATTKQLDAILAGMSEGNKSLELMRQVANGQIDTLCGAYILRVPTSAMQENTAVLVGPLAVITLRCAA